MAFADVGGVFGLISFILALACTAWIVIHIIMTFAKTDTTAGMARIFHGGDDYDYDYY